MSSCRWARVRARPQPADRRAGVHLAALLLIAAGLLLAGARPGPEARSARARTLDRWALEIVLRATSTVEERQRAMRYIEEAVALEPDHAGHWLVLGRLRDIAEEDVLARAAYLRSIALAPGEPEPRMRLAASWKRTWLLTLDFAALDRAIAQLDTVTRLRPYGSEAWTRLVPLHYERGDLARAAQAAERALEGRPRRVEAPLAAGLMAHRLGYLETADSLFRAAIPGLEPELRQLFEDPLRLLGRPMRRDSVALVPLVSPAEGPPAGGPGGVPPADSVAAGPGGPPPTVGSAAGASGAAAFPTAALPFEAPHSAATASSFADLDPDPTTEVNEAELEVWSRIAHAHLLLSDPRRPGLDARAETYIRYGPPLATRLNPAGTPLYFLTNPLARGKYDAKIEFPLHALIMDYPDLGMAVLLHDRSLTGRYTEPFVRDFIPGTTPDPGVLARRSDLIALGGGRGVIATLPPRDQRLDVRGLVLGFEGERGRRVLVQARVSASPAEAVTTRWLVRDAAGREVARGEQSPAVSACNPAEFRLAEFASDLAAGRYDVAVSVRDAARRRGLYRTTLALAPTGAGVGLSDLVLCCGDPSQLADERGVRIEANLDAVVSPRGPLVVYFEIYRLARDADGLSRFRYEYEVKRWTDDRSPRALREAERRPPVDRWVSRDETHSGAMRRQFVRVQTGSLMSGRHQVRVRVRDLVARTDAERMLEFVME